jgi:hypothetical protein
MFNERLNFENKIFDDSMALPKINTILQGSIFFSHQIMSLNWFKLTLINDIFVMVKSSGFLFDFCLLFL